MNSVKTFRENSNVPFKLASSISGFKGNIFALTDLTRLRTLD